MLTEKVVPELVECLSHFRVFTFIFYSNVFLQQDFGQDSIKCSSGS
uniref:Uncharacterized protein n=1 Tax=Anguilla anguilla TaxID=7936 RepID=A0A0E9RUF2_ANGAN